MTGVAQPAMMYIVPLTLGTFLIMATCRGDIKKMWKGGEVQDDEE